jgi:hypothetical protein
VSKMKQLMDAIMHTPKAVRRLYYSKEIGEMTKEDALCVVPYGEEIVVRGRKCWYGRMTMLGSYFAEFVLIPLIETSDPSASPV